MIFSLLVLLSFTSSPLGATCYCEINSKGDIQADVVVIGAGYAGLTAARELTKLNYTVHVVEATNTTGGRTKNFDIKQMAPDVESDYVIELGGEWIGDKTIQPHAWELIVEELGFKTFMGSYTPDPKLINVLYASNGVHNFSTLIEAFHKLPLDVQAELTLAWKELDSLASGVSVKEPYNHPRAREWDSMTFTSWINQTAQLEESRNILNILCTSMIAQSPDVVSFLHILFYIRASSGLEALVVDEQAYRIVGGTQAPTFKMARELSITYSAPVHRVIQNEDFIDCKIGSVIVEASEGQVTVHARHVVVTGTPPTSGRRIEFHPPLHFEKNQLFQRMPAGNSVKASIVYPTPFWNNKGYSGTILASVPTFGQPNNPLLSNCFDNTPYSGHPGVLMCFLEGDTSLQLMRLTHKERTGFISNWLSKSLGPEARDPNLIIRMIDHHWAEQPYIGGAYSSFFTPGGWTQFGHALRVPYGRVHWAGADYAEDGFGYISGAIQSGKHAAAEIDEAIKNCGKQ